MWLDMAGVSQDIQRGCMRASTVYFPAAEAREAEARIREAQQKHQELESERAVLRHKALASRAAEQVRAHAAQAARDARLECPGSCHPRCTFSFRCRRRSI